jgi:hypothetical protein
MRDIIKGNPEYFAPADVLLAQDDNLDVEMWWYAQSKSLYHPAAFFGVPLFIDEDMPDDAMAFFTHQFGKPKPNYTMSLQDV